MSSKFMPEKQAIALHLSGPKPAGSMTIFSGFAAALRDSRQTTGRNPDDGTKVNPQQHGNWLGALGYMALLDQIGKCFKPKSVTASAGLAIEKALRHFTKCSDDEVKALYALRNAFAHDFALFNKNGKDPKKQHLFEVRANNSDPLIQLPVVQWDGDIHNKRDNNVTIVNLEKFGDLIESVCVDLFGLANKDELDVLLDGGTDELLQRYSFYTRSRA